MDAKELEKRFGFTEEQLNAMAEPFERGEWPEGKTIPLGRPRLAEEEVRTVTFKLPLSQIRALDDLAKASGMTRSEAIRNAVKHELAATSAA